MIYSFFSEGTAFPFSPQTLNLFAILQRGGPLMWLILLGSVLATGVFVERWLYFRERQIGVDEFLLGINAALRKRNYQEALERCDAAKSPVVRVVFQAICARNKPPLELREIVREVAQMQLPRLESNLSVLSTLGHVMPLIGLLGTVTGMIEAFIEINRAAGAASVSDIASGIWTALITTGAGLAVAIPCEVAYNYLVTQLNGFIADMERAGIEVIHVLTEAATDPTRATTAAGDPLTLMPPEEPLPRPVTAVKTRSL